MKSLKPHTRKRLITAWTKLLTIRMDETDFPHVADSVFMVGDLTCYDKSLIEPLLTLLESPSVDIRGAVLSILPEFCPIENSDHVVDAVLKALKRERLKQVDPYLYVLAFLKLAESDDAVLQRMLDLWNNCKGRYARNVTRKFLTMHLMTEKGVVQIDRLLF